MYLITINSGGYSNVTKEIILKSEPFIGEHDKYHYCYELYVPSTGWIYRGVRSCKDWSTDKYLGSSCYHSYKIDINESKHVQFRILSFHETRENANIEETILTDKEFIDSNGVYNKSVPVKGFTTYNCVVVKDKDGNTFSVKCDDPRYLSGEAIHINKNMTVIKDAHNNKFSISVNDPKFLSRELVGHTKGKTIARNIFTSETYLADIKDPRWNTGELVGINKGMINVFDSDRNVHQVSIEDPRYKSSTFISINKNKVPVRDINGNTSYMYTNDPRYLSGEFIATSKGQITVKDKYGKTLSISVDDPRYINGELVHIFDDMISVRDTDGNMIKIKSNDPRWISGELVGSTKGYWCWNKMITINEKELHANKWAKYYKIKLKELESYLINNNINFKTR